MQAPRCISNTQSSLRRQASSHIDRVQLLAPQCFCCSVGAGLPAMQAPRCISNTQSTPTQASQLPH
ncbi:hypothetical protein C7U57_24460 [Pseudomonas sp. R9.37]|nr:hypothetical protein C7U57_24460 [Pseudomonas sp. R9.37]